MKKILTIFLFITTVSTGQSAGNAGMSFLKIGFGARQLALSDFGIVGINDVTSYNYNPALRKSFSISNLFTISVTSSLTTFSAPPAPMVLSRWAFPVMVSDTVSFPWRIILA